MCPSTLLSRPRGSIRGETARASGLLAAAILALAGCMPLPPGGGVDVGSKSDQWTVRFDPVLGSPISLVNRSLENAPGAKSSDSAAIDPDRAEAAVRAVIQSRPEWFHLRPGYDDFRVVRSETRGWLRYLRLEQTYRGVSVAGAGYEAHVLPDGRVGSLEGRYIPGIALDERPLLSELQADDRARSAITPGDSRVNLPPVQYELANGFRDARVLAILPSSGGYRLAWGVVLAVGTNGHARIYVDARDGTPLASENVGWADPR